MGCARRQDPICTYQQADKYVTKENSLAITKQISSNKILRKRVPRLVRSYKLSQNVTAKPTIKCPDCNYKCHTEAQYKIHYHKAHLKDAITADKLMIPCEHGHKKTMGHYCETYVCPRPTCQQKIAIPS